MSVGTGNESTRHQWVEGALKAVPAGARLLDAGAGEMRYRKFCEHLEYVSQDFGKYTGAGDGTGLQEGAFDASGVDITCDICNIPQPDASFDAVLCTEVLEHLPDPIIALREFARLIRPGGELILTAPFASLTHYAPFHFASGFNRYFYERHLPDCGFQITELTTNGNYFEFLAQEVRRIGQVAAKYGGGKGRLGIVDRIGIKAILRLLQRVSGASSGSEELLCFGIQVRAVRA